MLCFVLAHILCVGVRSTGKGAAFRAAAMGNSLDKQFKKYADKEEIDLSRQELKELPPAIGQCQMVVKLNISENDIGQLPLEIRAHNLLLLLVCVC